MQRHMSLHHPDMPYAYTAYITNMGNCARRQTLQSNTCEPGIRCSDRENAQGDHCFSGSYFSSFHSTQLTLITADSAVIKVLG